MSKQINQLIQSCKDGLTHSYLVKQGGLTSDEAQMYLILCVRKWLYDKDIREVANNMVGDHDAIYDQKISLLIQLQSKGYARVIEGEEGVYFRPMFPLEVRLRLQKTLYRLNNLLRKPGVNKKLIRRSISTLKKIDEEFDGKFATQDGNPLHRYDIKGPSHKYLDEDEMLDAFSDMVKDVEGEILIISKPDGFLNMFPKVRRYWEQLKTKGVPMKGIFFLNSNVDIKSLPQRSDHNKNVKDRATSFPMNQYVIIYNDVVITLSMHFKKHQIHKFALMIKDKNTANTMRSMFYSSWNQPEQ